MKYCFFIAVLLCASPSAFSGEEYLRTRHSNSEEELDVTSLTKAARDRIAWVRPGLTRAKIEKYFEEDGGLSTEMVQSYCLKGPVGHAKVVKLELTFQPAGMPDKVFADQAQASEWVRNHKTEHHGTDILRGISKPYLEAPIID